MSRSLLRTAARLRPPSLAANRSATTRRDFHIQPQDVPGFLSSTGIAGLDGVVGPSSSSAHHSTSRISILVHADRSAQAWPAGAPPGVSDATFWGPSIVAAPSSALSPYRQSEDTHDGERLGQGSLGLLKLRKEKPDAVRQLAIPSGKASEGLSKDTAQQFLRSLSPGRADDTTAEVLSGLCQVFDKHEGLWFTFELETEGDSVKVLNPFLEFDPFAVPRQPLLKPFYESRPLDDNSLQAERGGLFYIKLPPSPLVGKVGCFGYGAGNAMATMDGLNLVGGGPANFLDGGGGANRQNAKLAIETLNRDEDVKAIFVNSFGGITRTDIVAQGIIDAVRENHITKPIVARMKGTGSEEAAKVLRESGLDFAFHDDFRAAAAHAVRAAQDGHL